MTGRTRTVPARARADTSSRELLELRRLMADQQSQIAELTVQVDELIDRVNELADERRELRRLVTAVERPPSAPGGAALQPARGTSRLDPQRYDEIRARLRQAVRARVPHGRMVAVVSRGDDRLLELDGRRGWHFPRDPGGGYAGHYPADDAAAIAQMEALRQAGADFLVFPATAFWWQEHYRGFAEHLARTYRVVHQDDACMIHVLRETPAPGMPLSTGAPALEPTVAALRGLIESLLPADAVLLAVTDGDDRLLDLAGRTIRSFPRADASTSAGDPIAALEQLRADGAEYVIVPSGVGWRHDLHPALINHLERRYRSVVRQRHVGTIYALR